MSTGCTICREWGKHYYWNHMDERKVHFCKIMTEKLIKRMTLPEDLVTKGLISESVDLYAPNGEFWRVQVGKSSDKLVLQLGWDDFVQAQCIEEKDILVFKYRGNSSFDFIIFDVLGNEKASSHVIKNSHQCFHECATEVHRDRYSTGRDGKGKEKTSEFSVEIYERDHRKIDNVMLSSAESSFSGSSWTCPKKPSNAAPSLKCIKRKMKVKEEPHEDNATNMYFSSKSQDLTKQKKMELMNISLPIKRPGNPVFVVILQKNHCSSSYGVLNIPREFAANHLPTKKQTVFIQKAHSDRKYPASYFCYRTGCLIRGEGWMSFVCKNGLQEGHVCFFELTSGDEYPVTLAMHTIA